MWEMTDKQNIASLYTCGKRENIQSTEWRRLLYNNSGVG